MEIVNDTTNSSTERNNPPPPNALTPSITRPPSPHIAPPPQTLPSDPEPLNRKVTNRQILQPVPPSKRAPPEISREIISEESESVALFIPKELAEIVAVRQRRERAWHARFQICTSII